jgi:hypothetical protein
MPFERFTALKAMVEQRKRWKKIDNHWSYFETQWRPKSWNGFFRFIFTRKKTKPQCKGPCSWICSNPGISISATGGL